MERLSHSVFHSFGLAHTRCVSGSSGLTDHFQKFLRIRERTSSPEPLDLYELASKLFFLQLCWAVHPKSSLLADFYHHHPLQDLWWQSPVQVILWACTEKRVELEPTVKSRQTNVAATRRCVSWTIDFWYLSEKDPWPFLALIFELEFPQMEMGSTPCYQDQQISSAIPSISLETNFSTSPVMPGESRAIRTLPSLSCSLSGEHGHLSSKLMWLSTKFRLEASCSLAVPPRSPLFPVCIKSLVFWGVVNLLKLK